MRPAKQCTSMPSGITPLFNWSLTYSPWLFPAVILKIPSACTDRSKISPSCEQSSHITHSHTHTHRACKLGFFQSRNIFHKPQEKYNDAPEGHVGYTNASARAGGQLEYYCLCDHKIVALIRQKLQKQWHCQQISKQNTMRKELH